MTEITDSSRLIERGASFGRDLYEEFQASNVPFMAGSIAYSAFVSLFPLLVLAVIVATIVGGEEFAQYVVAITENYLSPSGQQLITQSLDRATARASLSVLTFVVFLWATLRVFRGLDVAFSILYRTDENKGILDQIKDGLVVLLALSVAVSGSIVTYLVLELFPSPPYVRFLEPLVLLLFLTIVFLPMYYIFPDLDLSVRQVLPGAVVAAVGWTILQFGFRLYVQMSDKAELYGVIGGVILIITWLYFGSLVVLLGATVNVVLDRDTLSQQPQD